MKETVFEWFKSNEYYSKATKVYKEKESFSQSQFEYFFYKMNRILLLAVFGILLFVTFSNAKNLLADDDLEVSDEKAQMYIRTMRGEESDDDSADDSADLDTRQSNQRCVACKLGIIPCCKPNICKNRLGFDKCIRIKVGK